MKKYTKPALMALSISANDMLCSGCGADPARDNGIGAILLGNGFDSNGDGIVDWSDFGEKDFGQPEACKNQAPGLESYCKHTSVSTIFWS